MTDQQDQGQPSWQPQQYDPAAHQRRISGGQPPYPPQGQPPRRKRHIARNVSIAVVGLVAIFVGVGVASGGHGSSSSTPPPVSFAPAAPAATQTAAQTAAPAATQAASSAPAAPQTVTYDVTGSPADVTYGPAGSDLSGSVPMHVTKPLGSPAYYAVSAQLQGGGTVSCEIKVDGTVISSATASGGYNIASCEISQDPLSGNWQDTNAG